MRMHTHDTTCTIQYVHLTNEGNERLSVFRIVIHLLQVKSVCERSYTTELEQFKLTYGGTEHVFLVSLWWRWQTLPQEATNMQERTPTTPVTHQNNWHMRHTQTSHLTQTTI